MLTEGSLGVTAITIVFVTIAIAIILNLVFFACSIDTALLIAVG